MYLDGASCEHWLRRISQSRSNVRPSDFACNRHSLAPVIAATPRCRAAPATVECAGPAQRGCRDAECWRPPWWWGRWRPSLWLGRWRPPLWLGMMAAAPVAAAARPARIRSGAPACAAPLPARRLCLRGTSCHIAGADTPACQLGALACRRLGARGVPSAGAGAVQALPREADQTWVAATGRGRQRGGSSDRGRRYGYGRGVRHVQECGCVGCARRQESDGR